MSLLRSSSASLFDFSPVIFIEARIQGPPEITFSQLGISFEANRYSIALFVRTSGVILVVSVGSYMMYRICSRLLGRNFMWTVLEQARFDFLARNSTYLSSSKPSEPHMTTENTCSEQAEEIIGLYSNCYGCISPTLLSSKSTPLKDHLQRKAQTKQLCATSVDGSYRQQHSHNPKLASECDKYSLHAASDDDTCRIEFTSSDEKSASLHLVWDDPQWDEQADCTLHGGMLLHRRKYSTTSDVSNMTEFRGAKELFTGWEEWNKTNSDYQWNSDNGTDQECAWDREERCSDFDTNDFIQKNCLADSKYLYRIAPEYMTTTDSKSISSGRSSQSFLSLRHRFSSNTAANGLLELATSSTLSSAERLLVSMTDSGISKGTTASTSNLQSSVRLDTQNSYAGAELFSSNETFGGSVPSPSQQLTSRSSIIRRTGLNLISEDRCSPSTSFKSTEWFEDDFCPYMNKNPVQVSPKIKTDNCLFGSFSCSVSGLISANSMENKKKYLYSITRDLLTWAREQFTVKSPQMKVIHSLYTSHRRWRRIGLKRSTNCSQQFLTSVLHSMFLYGIPFFSCDVMVIVKVQDVQRAFSHYEFVRQWQYFDNENMEIENKEKHAVRVVRTLWDVQHGSLSLKDELVEHQCVEAIRLLTLLWIVLCFEKSEDEHQPSDSTLYSAIFGNNNPRQIIANLCTEQLSNDKMVLFTNTLRIRLELLDISCCSSLDVEQDELPRSWVPSGCENELIFRPVLTFLKFNDENFLYPLYNTMG